MAAKPCTALMVAGLIVAAILAPNSARAIEVKKDLYKNGGPAGPSAAGPSAAGTGKQNPIPKAQQQALMDTVASESDSYLSDESEKKASGKLYVDLEHAKFTYLPAMKEGHWTVLAKLQAAEYMPSKSGEGKGRATGKQKILVFNYRLDGSKWAEVEAPKWQDVETKGAAAAAHK
jgi:hypothetical protein